MSRTFALGGLGQHKPPTLQRHEGKPESLLPGPRGNQGAQSGGFRVRLCGVGVP